MKKIKSFGLHVAEMNDELQKDVYKNESIKSGLKEAAAITFGRFNYHDISLSEDNSNFNQVEKELKDILEYERRLMMNKSHLLGALTTRTAILAREVASKTSPYLADQVAQVTLFSALNEIANIEVADTDKDLQYGTQAMLSLMKDVSNDVRDLIKIVRQSGDEHKNMKAVMLLRKARISGSTLQLLDALTAVMSVFVGGNNSDLVSRVK